MSFRSKLFAGVFAVSAFAVAASAQVAPVAPKDGDQKVDRRNGRMGKGIHGERMRGFGLRGINLTDAQKVQIRQIHEANKPSETEMATMKSIREARKAGTELTADQKATMQAFRDARKAKMQSVHEQVLAVLTAEQRAQLEQRKAEMKQRRGEMRQRMQERRQLRQKDAPKTTEPTKDN